MSGIVVVTGGSRGIGAACATTLGELGYKVVVNYASNKAAAQIIVDQIRQSGSEAIAVQGDVGHEEDVIRLFEETDKTFGTLTALVNNAGVVDVAEPVAEMSYERLDRMMRINVIGSFICAREAVNRMAISKGGKGGAIVNLSSAAALIGSPNQYVDYAASKGAIDTFTKGLALEVAADGIRVNAVRPGIINTDIHASGGIPDRVEKMKHAVPMKREGSAQEVANAIVYLLSGKASYSTATYIDVSGGR